MTSSVGVVCLRTSVKGRRSIVPSRRIALALAVEMAFSVAAYGNPTGPQVVNGQVSFNSRGNTLAVTNTPGSIINWQSFSIANGETTQFIQQSANSAVLNRITGQNPSQIFGTLTSNGKVYLINPNGVLFGPHSQVDVAGLAASSLGISNADFLAGNNRFDATGSAGSVSNAGNISTPSGGLVYLIAPDVQNSGVITSPQGNIMLAAGHHVVLVDGANPDLQVVVSAPTDQALNLGQVVAQAGRIGIFGAMVTQSGVVNANSAVVGANGEIVLKASQSAALSGNSQTTATGAGDGGTVEVQGNQISLTDRAVIDASGQANGGNVWIGGGFHGADPAIQNASSLFAGAGTTIRADAGQQGNGGNIALWSELDTEAHGAISAHGGALFGNGGAVETSGHYLNVNDLTVDAAAAHGKPGSWLLDPYDITIGSGSDNIIPGGTNPLTYTGVTSGSSFLSTTTVVNELNGGTSVVVDTSGAGLNYGTITVSSAITITTNTASSLTLLANRDIDINAGIVNTGNPINITLTADQLNTGTGAVNIAAPITTNNGNLVINAGSGVSIVSGGYLNTGNIYNAFGGNSSISISAPNVSSTVTIAQNGTNNLINTEALTIDAGSMAINGYVNASNGAMKLTALSANGITNGSGTGLLTAGTLEVNSAGPIAIIGYNNIGTVAANVTGVGNTLTLENAATGGLTVGAVGSTTGLTAPGDISVRQYSSNGITVANAINATSGNVTLGIGSGSGGITVTSTGSVSGNNVQAYTSGGNITANGPMTAGSTGTLTLDTESAGTIEGTGLLTANAFSLQPSGSGAIGLSISPLNLSAAGAGASLAVGFDGEGSSATPPSAVYLNATGALTVNQLYFAANSPVDISASGNFNENVSIATGSSPLSLGSGGMLTVPANVTLSGSNVTISANQVSFDPTDTINAGSGMLWLQPYSPSIGVNLGMVTGAMSTLELPAADLGFMTAGILRVGSTSSGPLSVNAPIAPTFAGTLSLQSGGTITQTAGSTITATNLAIDSLGSVTLDTATNAVTNLAASVGDSDHTGQNFIFKNGAALNLGTGMDGLSGISITEGGDNYNASSPAGFISLTTTAGMITQSNGAQLGSWAAALNGYAGVTLQQANPVGVIAGSTSTGDFIYNSSNGINLNSIYGANGLTIGGNHNVILSASSGGISQAAGANIVDAGGELVLKTTGAVNLPNAGNNVAYLVADLSLGNTGTGSLSYANSTALTINDASSVGLTGIQTNNQNIDVLVNNGATLAINQPLSAGTGQVELGAGGISQTGLINAQGLALQTTGAVNLSLGNNVSNLSGSVANGLTFNNVGSIAVTTTTLDPLFGSTVLPGVSSTGAIALGSTNANITVTTPITASGNAVTLTALTGAIGGSGLITASSLSTSSASGAALTTQVPTLTATNSGSGGITISNNSTTAGTLLLENVTQSMSGGTGGITIINNGPLTVDNSATISTAQGLGGINLLSNNTLTVKGIVAGNSASGSVLLDATGAGTIDIQPTGSITGSSLEVFASGGTITVDGALTASGAGLIAVDTGGAGALGGAGLLTANNFILQQTGSGAIGSPTAPLQLSAIGGGANNANLVAGYYASSPSATPPSAIYVNQTGSLTISQVATASNSPVAISASNSITDAASIATGTAGLSLSAGNALTIPASVSLSGGNINLTANSMSFAPTGTINAGSGVIWLQPDTASDAINLGLVTGAPNTLELNAAELSQLTAGTLRIGSMSAGPISINAPITPALAGTLSLFSSGTLTQTAGSTITVNGLAVQTLGSAILDTNTNQVSNIAASIGNASNQSNNFTFKNGAALNIANNLDGLSGISIAEGTGGYNPSNQNGYVALTTTAGAITQTTGALLGGWAVDLNGYSGVTLQQANPVGLIAGSTTTGDFRYTSANGIGITSVYGTNGLTVGGGHSAVLTATSAGGIGQAAGDNISVAGGELALKTTGAVSLTNAGNNVANLVADLSVGSTGTGSLAFVDGVGLTVNDAASVGITGIQTNNQSVVLAIGASAPLAINQAINPGTGFVALGAGSITQTGVINTSCLALLTTSGAVNLPLANNVTDFAVQSAGAVTLNSSATVTVKSMTLVPLLGSVSLSGASSAGPLSLTSTGGGITLDGAVSAGNNAVTLNAQGGSLSGSGLVSGGSLTATSLSGGTLTTQVPTMTVTNNGSGDINITNNQTTPGPLLIENISQTMSGGTGNIIINNYGATTVDAAAVITTQAGTGDVTVSAHSPLTVNGSILTNPTSGVITLEAGSTGNPADILTIGSGAHVNGGTIALHAGANIVVSGVLTGTVTQSANENNTTPPPPTLSQCIANPSLTGCSSVLPSLSQCTATPTLAGCSVVLPTLAQCTTAPTTTGCTAVLPTLAQCTTAPSTAGCTVVLPTLAQCTTAPTTAGCTAVLPTVAQCTAAPTTAGCAAVLPTLAQCTSAPTTAGCTAVLPTIAQCTSTPSAAGCSVVLPSVGQCTTSPTTAGCTAVLPSLAQCVAAPVTAGCSAVLPSLAQCTSAPTTAGCSVVLPTLAQCVTAPSTSGCSVVLPTLAQCIANPAQTGCVDVLPTLAQCEATPTLSGCAQVLPTTTQCAANPALPGCQTALPTLAQCESTPTLAGCSSVLPTLAQCTTIPTTPGCSVILPSLAQCESTPTVAGCSVVLPTLADCVANPTSAGCSVVLPTLAQCLTAPTVAGCVAILPSLAECEATPSISGCSLVLPPISTCADNPSAPGCSAVLPTVADTQDTQPVVVNTNTVVNAVNTTTDVITSTTTQCTGNSLSCNTGTTVASAGGSGSKSSTSTNTNTDNTSGAKGKKKCN